MNVVAIRPAPAVPAGPNSLAAAATRRGFLGAAAAAPFVGIAARAAPANISDVETAFSNWKAAHMGFEQPRDSVTDDLWQGRIDEAEAAIERAGCTSIRAIEIGLWVGLSRHLLMAHDHHAIWREDAAHILKTKDPESGVLEMLKAIVALRQLSMEGR